MARANSTDTFGVRGSGAIWQARFGQPLIEQDLLFSGKREPVSKRLVFDVPYDMFSKAFTVEQVLRNLFKTRKGRVVKATRLDV